MKERKFNIQKMDVKPDKDRLWRNITPYLLTDGLYREVNRESLQKGLDNLPVIFPEKNSWNNIESKINTGTKLSLNKYWKYIGGIAASIIIFVTLQLLIFHKSMPNKNDIVINTNDDIELFLANLCINNPQKCKTPDFLELKSEIVSLQIEKTAIYDQVFYHSDDKDINEIVNKIDEQISLLKKQIEIYVSI